MSFYVYVLASKRNGTLYIGMTDDLVRRVFEHRAGVVAGSTKKIQMADNNRRDCEQPPF